MARFLLPSDSQSLKKDPPFFSLEKQNNLEQFHRQRRQFRPRLQLLYRIPLILTIQSQLSLTNL
jgi:hypothetical protein